MILRDNLPIVLKRALAAERVLDVGGRLNPLNAATHVIDILPYPPISPGVDRDVAPRFSAATWTVQNICDAPWPFPDKHFDYSYCSNILEDVRDPLAVVKELVRVAKAGYVETPSRAREIFVKRRFTRLKLMLGRIPKVGFDHHRWFVEADGARLVFRAKTAQFLRFPELWITREELGRKLTRPESGLGIFWENRLEAVEILHLDDAAHREMQAFKAKTLAALRRGAGAAEQLKSQPGAARV